MFNWTDQQGRDAVAAVAAVLVIFGIYEIQRLLRIIAETLARILAALDQPRF